MSGTSPFAILELSADALERRVGALAALLRDCVLDGASVGFVLPIPAATSESFWRDKVLPGVRARTRLLLAAEADGALLGTVQLGLDTPPNQPHRADVAKLLVHPTQRRRGIACALMVELHHHAARLGRCLLTLDTRTGDPSGRLYTSLGYQTVGVIPGYCLDPTGERFDPTTIMYKTL
jgi:ribosomal protein S18 acetylase RimI-like enzyme